MYENIKIFGSDKVLKDLEKSENMLFACVLGNTAVSKIEGISGAGGSPEMTPYTPALDVELMLRNQALSLPEIAITESDEVPAPTPGLLTKTTYELLHIPFIPVSAGLEVEPKTSYISLNGQPGGDLREGKGVPNPEEIFENAKEAGQYLSQLTDHLMIGESTPAGTTTAQGVLTALGYDVEGKISGCMMHNPHELKKEVVDAALEKNNVKPGDLKDDPFKAVAIAGDPTIIAAAGMAIGSSVPVTLAGGTQMTAVLATIKAIEPDYDFSNIAIATTVYVANDETSDILDIVNQIGEIAVYAADPKMENSSHPGLASFAKGSVKEGVGAGGSVLYAYLKGITPEEYLAKLEELTAAVFG
ncbi:MAG: TIGR00303 family protein [Methanosphaera stadtmanae]|nr:TIGR00303 family protein [Methanosphaera stadtmanae]